MAKTDYRKSILVEKSPHEVFAAINNVRGWWSEEIHGDTDRLDAEFDFSYRDIHRSAQRITQFLPGKKVVWLAPEIECFNDCSKAWDFFVGDSLRSLIVTGVGKPNLKEKRIEESQI